LKLQEQHVSTATVGTATAGDGRDLLLIANISRGDRAAFEEFYLRYRPRIARFVWKLTSNNDLADEIANDVLWVVWERARQFRGDSKVSTWLFGIARLRGLRILQRAGKRNAVGAFAGEVAEEAHEPWSQAESREWVDAGLALLPAEQRLVLQLAYGLGQSCQEIAGNMGCPINTVKTRMYYGRQKLKLVLGRLAGLDESPLPTPFVPVPKSAARRILQ
jgi:RNA polymerase sigma-70 factor (ECF subfamily)